MIEVTAMNMAKKKIFQHQKFLSGFRTDNFIFRETKYMMVQLMDCCHFYNPLSVGAIHLMQDSEYGLTAAVYSANQKRAENILEHVNSGTGYWNCCDRVSAALPWSGRQHSGFGATLSHAGLRAFAKPKAFHLRG